MNDETGVQNSFLHSLIPLEDFKTVMGLDDREDGLDFASLRNQGTLSQPPSLAAFCLTIATYSIERYCMRQLLLKRHFERIEFDGGMILPLREYPVREVLGVWVQKREERGMRSEELIEPDLYRVIPDLEGETGETPEDTVYSLFLSPVLNRGRGFMAIKAVYRAGYETGEVPADLAAACMELAAWNMSRYRGRRIGMTGAVRGSGKDGEHLEASMPENVRLLLEPYRRRVI